MRVSKKQYSEGTPTLREWDGLWRYSKSEKPPSLEECNDATSGLWSHLETNYRVGVSFALGSLSGGGVRIRITEGRWLLARDVHTLSAVA